MSIVNEADYIYHFSPSTMVCSLLFSSQHYNWTKHNYTFSFIFSGADVNRTTTSNDQTVLSLACGGGHLAVVELLLQHNADANHKLKVKISSWHSSKWDCLKVAILPATGKNELAGNENQS